MSYNLYYKQFMEQFPLGYAYHKIICDESGRPCDYSFIEVNQRFESLTGLKRSDIVGKKITEVLPEIVNSEFNWIDFYGEIALKGEKKEFEQFSESLDSWYRVNAHSPQKGYFITIFSDISNERRLINELELQITQRKLAEDELRANEELLNASQRLSKVGGWEWNVETQAMFWTEETYRIHDFAPGEMEPGSAEHIKRSAECYEQKDRPVVLAAFQRCMVEGQSYDLELPFTTGKGRRLWIRTTAIPVVETGKVIRVIGNIIDITDRKKADEALKFAMQRAEAANESKSQFLSNMSHEIRTPMNGFMGMIQLMQTTELTDEQQDFMRIAKYSTDRLMNTVNDILDYSKIEAGKIQFEKTTFNLAKMMNDIIGLFNVSTVNSGLLIEASFGNDVPDYLVGDSFRLNQIISNLIGNAVKFTQKGGVNIFINTIKVQGNKQVKLEFEVKDTGIGIPCDRMDILFNSFSQVDNSNTRVYGGSGLGLSIAKGLVEKMGGEIWVESVVGQGSSFFFTCVFEKAVKQMDSIEPGPTMQLQEQRDISILIVEDEAVSITVIEKFAARKGWKVTIAENGNQAFDTFKRNTFDIVLMDVQIPTMNGYETTGIIRRLESLKESHTPIIAMTASALKGDREKCLEAGMDDYLSKPVDVNEFYTAIEKWTKNISVK